MKNILTIVLATLLVLAPAWGQFKHKKGKRVPKSEVYKAITAPVEQQTLAGHNPELDGYYPTASNAETRRNIKPEKFAKSQRKALRKERRLARRNERARRKRDRVSARTQLANERNTSRRVKVRPSR